jgi:hypothetical protein
MFSFVHERILNRSNSGQDLGQGAVGTRHLQGERNRTRPALHNVRKRLQSDIIGLSAAKILARA